MLQAPYNLVLCGLHAWLQAWSLFTGNGSGIAAELSETDLSKIVAKTEGYSGSDMRNLIQEACQGPVRNAMGQAAQLSALAQLSEADLRPVNLKDFQVCECLDHSCCEARGLCNLSEMQ